MHPRSCSPCVGVVTVREGAVPAAARPVPVAAVPEAAAGEPGRGPARHSDGAAGRRHGGMPTQCPYAHCFSPYLCYVVM